MKVYEESETVELKREYTPEIKKEIVAFLNASGGTIYIGVDDEGNVVGPSSQKEKDIVLTAMSNMVNDRAIYPPIDKLVSFSLNADGVIELKVKEGEKKPYYLSDKGPVPSGCYIRIGRSKCPMDEDEIRLMFSERSSLPYEERPSDLQELTFTKLKGLLSEKGIPFDKKRQRAIGFLDAKDRYTNLAYLFSDESERAILFAVYSGTNKDNMTFKREFRGPLSDIVGKSIDYLDFVNDTKVEKPKGRTAMRKEMQSYPFAALREALVNAVQHMDYSTFVNPRVEAYDDRVEITSSGGFYEGLTLKEAISGVRKLRNARLSDLLGKLGIAENYASGLSLIFSSYRGTGKKVRCDISRFSVTFSFPNLNYEDPKKDGSAMDGDLLSEVELHTYGPGCPKLVDGNEELAYHFLARYPDMTTSRLAFDLGVSRQTVARYIKNLKAKGLLRREGSDRKGRWIVLEKED